MGQRIDRQLTDKRGDKRRSWGTAAAPDRVQYWKDWLVTYWNQPASSRVSSLLAASSALLAGKKWGRLPMSHIDLKRERFAIYVPELSPELFNETLARANSPEISNKFELERGNFELELDPDFHLVVS